MTAIQSLRLQATQCGPTSDVRSFLDIGDLVGVHAVARYRRCLGQKLFHWKLRALRPSFTVGFGQVSTGPP